jgi:hypothetical protein
MPERLLYAISTRGKMTFTNYSSTFADIYLQVYKEFPKDISFTRTKFQTLRLLDALGHCDFDRRKRYVYACQPFFILIPSFGLPRVLLTGARNHELITHIRKFAADNRNFVRCYTIPQRIEYALLPPAIYLEAMTKDILENAASKVGISIKIDEPVAWRLINFSCDIHEIEKNASFVPREEPKWPKRTFSTSDLVFSRYQSKQEEMRLVEYTNPADQQSLHFLWQGDNAAEVGRDWGRFLILNKQAKNILLYDTRRFLLAVPTSVPLPRLISRALTLCTGLAPLDRIIPGRCTETMPKNCHFNIYQSVVPSIAEVVSIKLGQTPIKYDIEFSGDRQYYD